MFVDFRHPHIKRLVELRESLPFDAVFDIFIRDSVLPHLEGAFPDLRKRDFDALLRKLQSSVEYFEIDPADVGRIQQLASITKMSPEAVAAVFGGRRASSPRSTSVGRSDVVAVAGQVNQVVQQAMASQSMRFAQRWRLCCLGLRWTQRYWTQPMCQPKWDLHVITWL